MTKLFRNDSPGALTREQAVELEKKRMKERKRQAQALAAQGRGGDTEIAHVALGELVIPELLQTPELIDALRRAAAESGIPFDRLRVGSRRNSINPETGAAEFGISTPEDPYANPYYDGIDGVMSSTTPWEDHGNYFDNRFNEVVYDRSNDFGGAEGPSGGSQPQPPQQPYVYNGPVTEETTVKTPPWPNFAQLPQVGANRGFYSYGTPDGGRAQWGRQNAIDAVSDAGSRWNATGAPAFGVGNMSKEDGLPYGHEGHQMSGRDVDIRPIRRDGLPSGVTWKLPDGTINPVYDRLGTQRLVDTLRATGSVNRIYFNDPEIRGVSPYSGHDNHLHMEVNPSWRKR